MSEDFPVTNAVETISSATRGDNQAGSLAWQLHKYQVGNPDYCASLACQTLARLRATSQDVNQSLRLKEDLGLAIKTHRITHPNYKTPNGLQHLLPS